MLRALSGALLARPAAAPTIAYAGKLTDLELSGMATNYAKMVRLLDLLICCVAGHCPSLRKPQVDQSSDKSKLLAPGSSLELAGCCGRCAARCLPPCSRPTRAASPSPTCWTSASSVSVH